MRGIAMAIILFCLLWSAGERRRAFLSDSFYFTLSIIWFVATVALIATGL